MIKSTPERPRVLISPAMFVFERDIYEGMADFHLEHDAWEMILTGGPAESLARRVDVDKPDGVLLRVTHPPAVVAASRWPARVVNAWLTGRHDLVPEVGPDTVSAAAMAAEHLLDRGYRHIGFSGFPLQPGHDEQVARMEQVVSEVGAKLHVHRLGREFRPGTPWAEDAVVRDCGKWLASLPRPVGVVAAHDMRGHRLLRAARRIGLPCPEQLGLIGIGNVPNICEVTSPGLSSVDVNYRRVGYETAAGLDRLLRGDPLPLAPLRLSPRGVIERGSTDVLATGQPEVRRALEMIHAGASRGLKVRDVVDALAMSRRALEQLFMAHVGRTPGEEMQRARRKIAEKLLRSSDMSIKAVASVAGYSSRQHMDKAFAKALGMTAAQFRREK